MVPLHRSDKAVAEASELSAFARFVHRRTGLAFDDYRAFHAFSTQDIDRFWALFLEWAGPLATGSRDRVRVGSGVQESRFFPDLQLSWPENLLAGRGDVEEEAVALVAVDESGARAEVTRASLRQRVRSAAAGLAELGLREGDRVAAVVRNTIDTVVACLAVTSLGASWSSLAPDMGLQTALGRLRLLEPRVLLVHARSRHNGATRTLAVRDIVNALPSLVAVVRLDDGDEAADAALAGGGVLEMTLRAVESDGQSRPGSAPGPWRRFPFDHPLFILFSSGTTGAPKAIVHGHGGTLLEHLKEHRLHCDFGPEDRVCFQTSTGWMMWNWIVSALATGARVVLYEGSVSYPERDSYLQMATREGVTVLGLSPAYLRYLVDAGVNGTQDRLRGVRTILSTGSVLLPALHRWAREHLADAPIESISGGTDILGCFVMGSPWSDTYVGESSCAGLALDVRAWSERGSGREGVGELVCVQPFPSRPVGFLHDPEGTRLHKTYYEQHAGAWTHGDLVDLTARGTVRVLGRCDGMLNIRGIRIGPSEIYDILDRTIPEVAFAMAVDVDAPEDPGGKRLILFVVMRRGALLDRALTLRIKKRLKEEASSAHVPAAVVAVDDLPATFSNKISETAMQDALSGRPVRNLAALRNPDAIERAIDAWRRTTADTSRGA